LYKARKEYFTEQLKYHELNTVALNAIVKRDVRTAYYELWYNQDKLLLFQRLDSIYTSLFKAAELRVKTGEAAGLDRIAAEARMREIQARLVENEKEMQVQQEQLMMLLNINAFLLPVNKPLEKLALSIASNDSTHPTLALQQQTISIANSTINVLKNANKPEFSGRFFSQSLWGVNDPYSGFSVTAAFPLLGNRAYKNKVRAGQAEAEIQQKQFDYQTQQLNTQRLQTLTEIEKSSAMLLFYETSGLGQAEEIIRAATLSYNSGEISFAELSQFLSQAIDTRKNYLEVLNRYNQSVIQFNYYNNN